MFSLFVSALLALGGLTAHAALINGHNYTPLGDWARATGFYGFTRDHGHDAHSRPSPSPSPGR